MMEDLLRHLIERLDERHYGKHRGYVHRNDDPQDLGRIQAVVPQLFGEVPTGWAMPSTPYAGPNQGFYAVPDPGSAVWIEFEAGDLTRPIWSGGWWGRPTPGDTQEPDASAPHAVEGSTEAPHHHPGGSAAAKPEPGVRMIKSATGHQIVLDDRKGHERVEIRDRRGNRLVLDSEGLTRLIENERTSNLGSRSAEVLRDDVLFVGETQETSVGGYRRQNRGDALMTNEGALTETAMGGSFLRKIDHTGVTVDSRSVKQRVHGSLEQRVSGAAKLTATGGYGVTAGGGIRMASLGPLELVGAKPELPSLDAVSIQAGIGNISINSKLGILQLGGTSATSPLVLGDGLLAHHTMLAIASRSVFVPALLGYGPLFDAWAVLTAPMDLSYFAYVKRFPLG